MTALRVRDLAVTLPTAAGGLRVVDGVTFDLAAGEVLGLVGESGAGKTTVLRALLGLLPRGATVAGSVRLGVQFGVRPGVPHGVRPGGGDPGGPRDVRELVGLPERELARLRGRHLGMIFQDPSAALDPLRRVGGQVAEGPRTLLGWSRARARERTLELLRLMEVADPERVARSYPHQLSGGIRQRVTIAAALACEPAVLLCDEPTSALDVMTQRRTLALLHAAASRVGAALLLVSHDLALVQRLCGAVLVMHAGRVVEHGPASHVLTEPSHPYTRTLVGALPGARISASASPNGLALPGRPTPTRAHVWPGGSTPTRADVRPGDSPPTHADARPGGFMPTRADARPGGPGPAAGPRSTLPVLEVRDLRMHFRLGRPVLDGVDLRLHRAEILGLVGESGCGKTTLARCAAGLHLPTGGEVLLDGRAVGDGRTAADRRRVQLVFQDPAAALNPVRRVGGMLAELLRVHGLAPRGEVRQRCAELLRSVGLDAGVLGALPRALSGGQQQRVSLARALALRPEVIIADEVVSALDPPVQAAVLDLLLRLRERLGVAILFISHDLAAVRRVCDRVAVLHGGRIVEHAPAGEVFAAPSHPHTRRLLDAVPAP